MASKVIAIVGSYRKGGVIEQAVEAVLEGARRQGAETRMIRLTEKHIEFCTNCRECCQSPGPERGQCVQQDDLAPLLQEIESADALVLASPINYGNVTAIFRRFLERLIGSTYWPWGQPTPKPRTKWMPRKAVFIATSGMPGFLIPLLTGTRHVMKTMAKMLGAKPVGSLWIGLAAMEKNHALSARSVKQAQNLGMRLA
jgi:multimeric flavodoxin WrbA